MLLRTNNELIQRTKKNKIGNKRFSIRSVPWLSLLIAFIHKFKFENENDAGRRGKNIQFEFIYDVTTSKGQTKLLIQHSNVNSDN